MAFQVAFALYPIFLAAVAIVWTLRAARPSWMVEIAAAGQHRGIRVPGRPVGVHQLLPALRRAGPVRPGRCRIPTENARQGRRLALSHTGPAPFCRARHRGRPVALPAARVLQRALPARGGRVLRAPGRQQRGHQLVPCERRQHACARHRQAQRARQPGQRDRASGARRLSRSSATRCTARVPAPSPPPRAAVLTTLPGRATPGT